MTFAISFSGSIQEEGQQDPPKWKFLKGIMGNPRQAIVKRGKDKKKKRGARIKERGRKLMKFQGQSVSSNKKVSSLKPQF